MTRFHEWKAGFIKKDLYLMSYNVKMNNFIRNYEIFKIIKLE